MIFFVKVSFASCRLILFKFLIAVCQKPPVSQRLYTYFFLFAGGAISGKGENIGSCLYYCINNIRDLLNIRAGYSGHDHTADTGSVNTADLFQSNVKRTRLPEPVMSFSHAVQRKLILFTAIFFQFLTDLII